MVTSEDQEVGVHTWEEDDRELAPASSSSSPPLGRAGRPHRPLRVGLVGTAYWPVVGGMEVYLRDLATALASGGHDVRVGTRFVSRRPDSMATLFTDSEPSQAYQEDGVAVHVLSSSAWSQPALRSIYRFHFYASTRPLAERFVHAAFRRPLTRVLSGCDVVHYSGTGREMLGFVAAAVVQRSRTPLVITPHTHAGLWGDSAMDIDLYHRADRIVALTEEERERLVEHGLPEERIHVVGHGVSVGGQGDGRRFRRRHDVKGPIVFYLGRKTEEKGYGLLLAAADEVLRERSDAHIVLAGPGESEPPPSHPRIHDLGLLTDEEREDAYAACDVFCLPSSAEAFGLVYLEAGAYGKPVVALRIPTLEERIGRAGAGLLVERSAPALSGAILRLLRDDALRQRLGAAGLAVACRSTWEDVAVDMEGIYRSAVAGYAASR